MAKKLPKKTNKDGFFEAIGSSLPALQPTTTIFEDLASYLHRHRQFWELIREYSNAVASDAWFYTKRSVKRFASPRARQLYAMSVVTGVAATAAIAIGLGSFTLKAYANDIASPAHLMNKKDTGTTILDRNGRVLYQAYGANNRVAVKLKDLPVALKNATLSAEDPKFYQHQGFSWKATARAIYINAAHQQNLQGGSTITQQLVKNSLLSSEKSYTRKYQEILLASQLEHRYSKDEILEMYLNQINYGEGSYGVQAAAQTYFHKDAKDLSLSESALLAGLPLGPSRFDPNLYPELAKQRRNFILEEMRLHGFISTAEAEAAEALPMQSFARRSIIRAPHFVFYVLDQLRAIYGNNVVEQGGITVYTTLDLSKQETAQQIMTNHLSLVAAHNATNSGLVAIDPKTGDIITMVGSVNYYQPGWGALNVTTAKLQPGSSWKPFEYITAFKKGWNGATMVDDSPMNVPQPDGTFYSPHDYDRKWRGKVTVRRALQNSLNIPAIHALEKAGLSDTIQTAQAMGITGLSDPSQYGLSFALGAANVTPLDMATAYATIANHGIKVIPRAILRVKDKYGTDITKVTKVKTEPAIDPRIAYMITHILSDNAARAEDFGLNSPLKLSRPAAAKTGTTEYFTDDWTVGYVPQLATAVWVGNNDHSDMRGLNGIMGAAPIWHDYMEMALAGLPVEDFARPNGITTAKVCLGDGGLVNSGDSGYEEVFLSEAPQTKKCSSQAPKPKEEGKPKEQAQEVKPPENPGTGGGVIGEPPPPEPKVACNDGVDNDGDGKIDGADPGCSSPTDNDETDTPPPSGT